MERYLAKGYTLQMNDSGKYIITEMIGSGSSCAVYRAERFKDGIQTQHLLKEYNPRAVTVSRMDLNIALQYCLQALSIRERLFGKDHPDVAVSLNSLGELYHNKGDYDTALQYYEQSLAIRKRIYGEDNLDVAASKGNLGAVYYNKGDLDNALHYMEQAYH